MDKFTHNDHPVIFDVGANVGQSIRKFRRIFPSSTIHSFEPSPRTFETLKQQVNKLESIHLWNYALGSSSGSMNFLENSYSDMSSFLPISEYGWGKIIKETLVEVKTIDQFCHEKNIEKIDILKSDTQGFELEVFQGAENTIKAQKIGLIYFEVIFSDMYKNLPSFGKIYNFLTERDFLLVNFYKFNYQNNLASWTDALFVHNSYIQVDAKAGRGK
ncbi:FkbM family methyltransferase [Coleofasciculus sp. G2-EDA-02]|uniref:FkbM family methyltransferase n=1 Tax=Coleofasciculus sp. G2-EDA-02 TaxID=3069529 RepID=UPI004062F629